MKPIVFLNLSQLFSIKKRTKALISLICFFCFVISLQAQQLEWAKKFHNVQSGLPEPNDVVVDDSGNVYTLGYFNGVVDFDPGIGTYYLTCATLYHDFFVSKLNSLGDLVWAKNVGGNNITGYSIVVDGSENVYITGDFSGTIDFDPSPDTCNLTSSGSNDVFISKLDANGDFMWAKKVGGPSFDGCRSILLDSDGSIYTSGYFQSTADFDPGLATYNLISAGQEDAFICKLDSSGNFLWAKKWGGIATDNCISVAQDRNGNLYATGTFGSTVDFDPGPGVYNLTSSAGNNSNAFIVKLDSSGNFKWAKKIDGISTTAGLSIKVDDSENVCTVGIFGGTADFDPGAGSYNLTSAGGADVFVSKLDSVGDFIWAKNMGGVNQEDIGSMATDNSGNIYVVGYFLGTADFDPNVEQYNLTSLGDYEAFISILDSDGNFVRAFSIGSWSGDFFKSIAVDTVGNFYVVGGVYGLADFDPSMDTFYVSSPSEADCFVAKYSLKGVFGKIYKDFNENCYRESNESGIIGRRVIINPGNILIETDNSGTWYLDTLFPGNYTITFDTSGHWLPTCPAIINFTVANPNSVTVVPSFGMISTQPCAQPDVSITSPLLRRCFSNQVVYVQACNQNIATGALNGAYVDVELDSLITPISASLSYTSLGNNQYRFNVGNIYPGQCINFTINTTVSCAANLQQTLCMEARLFPADSCVFDTIPANPVPGASTCTLPWDHSSLSVDGYCANDTVYFTVTNNGSAVNGNMQCYAPVRIYVDGILTYVDSILLSGGQTITYSYPGNGQTWILQADQHPLHPGNSHPNAHVEACGNIANWTPNLVNNLPLDDADPIVDIYCGVVSGAYDPNDKTGFPIGLGTDHEILPNQQIQYMIRFQNTGTDTAFNIVVRDTLDTDLNIFSVFPGVASHNYSFRMYGPRVLEWTFNNIMLPDSNVNESASHGFATFRVDQQPNLSNGTTILNDADIYFDFNAPVITNETVHTINNQLHNFAVGIKSEINHQKSAIKVYPNPASNNVTIVLAKENVGSMYSITNQLGQIVLQGKLNAEQNLIDINNLQNGFYVVTVENKSTKQIVKLVKQ